MSNIVAENIVNGLRREFTELQWGFLGKTKGNWREVNPVKANPEGLETGDKKDIIENNTEILEEVSIIAKPVGVDDKTKEGFYSACTNINKGRLKDFLDRNNIKYEQNNTVKNLVDILGVAYNYDKQIVKDNF